MDLFWSKRQRKLNQRFRYLPFSDRLRGGRGRKCTSREGKNTGGKGGESEVPFLLGGKCELVWGGQGKVKKLNKSAKGPGCWSALEYEGGEDLEIGGISSFAKQDERGYGSERRGSEGRCPDTNTGDMNEGFKRILRQDLF